MLVNDDNNPNINVPPNLPLILKQFCKAAIRTQPFDLLKWSSAYFRALAEGNEPPIKLRLEYPISASVSGLTLGFLKILFRQFGDYNKTLPIEVISRRWDDLSLDPKELNLILIIGKFKGKCQVKKFLSIAAGILGTSLLDTMYIICELFTMESDGGSAMIPVGLFMEIYSYLAKLRCDGGKREKDDEEDPTKFIIIESSEATTPVPSQPFYPKDNNQDTEDDVNLEFESISKEDSSNEMITNEKSLKEDHFNGENDDKNKSTQANDGAIEEISLSSKSSGSLTDDKTLTSEDSTDNSRKLNKKAKKKLAIDPNWITHYPNIPGIGPSLTSEEISAVKMWINECGLVQEGMVGPRNLRHFQCPPLDRIKTPTS